MKDIMRDEPGAPKIVDRRTFRAAMTSVLRRSGKLGMLLRDEFLTLLRYYK